jgi:hypothetical protein
VPEHIVASGGWVVLWQLPGHPEQLLAWRCGARKPRVLTAHLASSAQYAAGIVTWIARGGTLYAERLSSGRVWRWRSPYRFRHAVHTANTVFAVENCPTECQMRFGGNRVLDASLAGL